MREDLGIPANVKIHPRIFEGAHLGGRDVHPVDHPIDASRENGIDAAVKRDALPIEWTGGMGLAGESGKKGEDHQEGRGHKASV